MEVYWYCTVTLQAIRTWSLVHFFFLMAVFFGLLFMETRHHFGGFLPTSSMGEGMGRVSKVLPRPLPQCTLPKTRTGYPTRDNHYPCVPRPIIDQSTHNLASLINTDVVRATFFSGKNILQEIEDIGWRFNFGKFSPSNDNTIWCTDSLNTVKPIWREVVFSLGIFRSIFCWISKDKLRVPFHLFGLTGGRFHCMYYILFCLLSMTFYLNIVVIYIVTVFVSYYTFLSMLSLRAIFFVHLFVV